jgi:hypothetical protein
VHRVLERSSPMPRRTDAVDFERIRLPPAIECWPVLRDDATAGQAPRAASCSMRLEAGRDGARTGVRPRCWPGDRAILGGGLDAGNVAAAIATVRAIRRRRLERRWNTRRA